MEKVYYYTSFGVLHNIVTNRELWLNSVWSMADYTEIRYFIKSIQKHLETAEPDKNWAIKRFFEKVYKALNKTDFYTMSFTKARDDVAMWERFAKSGKGVCLVFDWDKLAQFATHNGLIINELFYQTEIKNHEHTKNIRKWLANKELSGFASVNTMIENLIMTSVFHKDPAFRSENEFRMSTTWTPRHEECVYYKLVSETIRKAYILTESEVKGTIKLSDMICEVIIGPTSRQSERELQDFLKRYRYNDTIVSKSACPL